MKNICATSLVVTWGLVMVVAIVEASLPAPVADSLYSLLGIAALGFSIWASVLLYRSK